MSTKKTIILIKPFTFIEAKIYALNSMKCPVIVAERSMSSTARIALFVIRQQKFIDMQN